MIKKYELRELSDNGLLMPPTDEDLRYKIYDTEDDAITAASLNDIGYSMVILTILVE
jgi:DNA-binding transcriptional MerR regulator